MTTGIDTALLSTLYDIAFAGTVIMFLPLVQRLMVPLHSAGRRTAAATLGWVVTLAPFGGVTLLLVFPGALVTRFDEFDFSRGALLGVMLALGVGSAMWRRVPRPNVRPFYYDAEDEVRSDPPVTPPVSTPVRKASKLSGLGFFIWTDWTRTATVSAIIVLAYAVLGGVFVALTAAPSTVADALLAIGLLPFDSRTPGAPAFVALITIGLFSAAGYRRWSMSDWLVDMPRHFRALPLRLGTHVGLLLALPLFGWGTLYAVLAALHIVATGTWPSALRLELVALFAGVDALSRAIALRFHVDKVQSTLTVWLGIFLILVAAAETGYGKTLVGPAAAYVTGIVMLTAAALAFHRTLARSPAAYSAVPNAPRAA